jgi:PAS domain S-box-containing protein
VENVRVPSEELQSLEDSAELRAVTDSVSDYAIYLLDPSGRILTWNTGAQQLKGYAPGEIIGQSFQRFYTEEDRLAGRPQRLLQIAASEDRVEDEGWRVRKDGSRFWADVVLSAIRTSDGGVRGYVKVTRDLTERRRAEEELKHSEERLRLMIHSVKDYAIFLLDPAGHIVSWNSGAERLKGYSAGEIIGRHFSIFYPPEDVESRKPQRELEIAATTGRFEEEGFRLRKDGSRFYASVVLTAVRTPQGELVGFTKVTRDVTERKLAAEELEERARQQTAISNLGLYALQTRELDEVVEGALRTIRESLQVEDVRLLRGGQMPSDGSATVAVHAPDRESDPYGLLTVRAAPPLSGNDVIFLEAIANVIASAVARNRIEEQLRVAELEAFEERGRTQQAQDALRERDEFISVAAHELRTPLTALQLKLQGLERGLVRDADKKTERLEGAVRQTERLARLIDRLLDVSRIAQGRLELSPEEFDLSTLVRQVADDFRDPAANARVLLELQLPEKAEGTWDRLRIEQILVNLLSNAVKYGAGKPVIVKLEIKDDVVRLTVADRGIGIASQDVNRIFGRFQRAAPTRHYGGMGLGLYITRHIVDAHQGTISVDSAAGEGATFVVELPRFAVPSVAGLHRVPQARM